MSVKTKIIRLVSVYASPLSELVSRNTHIIRFMPNFGRINEVSHKVSLGVNQLVVTFE